MISRISGFGDSSGRRRIIFHRSQFKRKAIATSIAILAWIRAQRKQNDHPQR